MANPKRCWYCLHFKGPTLIGTNQGECHRYAPAGVAGAVAGPQGEVTQVWPEVYDGTTEWCGDFQANPGEVPDPS